MTPPPPATRTALAARAYLALFPAAHLVVVPVAGAMATGADVLLAGLVGVWVVDVLARREARGALLGAWRGGGGVGLPGRGYVMGILTLGVFGGWVALSALWGAHPGYALVKGAGTLALALGALALATSGLGWRKAADAWLVGAALVLAVTAALLVLGAVGVAWARERVAWGGSGIVGLPWARVSGPFLHPNMLGDYLVVSGALLWGRWPEWTAAGRRAAPWRAGSLAVALACALVLTASTAWVGAGVVVAWLGVRRAREGRAWQGAGLVGGGALAALGVTFLVTAPGSVHLLGLELSTSALRPAIWMDGLRAFVSAPLAGIGAAPWVAAVVDPAAGGSPTLFDAHNAYLSVLGQFGMVGGVLVGVGVWGVVGGASGGGAAVGLAGTRLGRSRSRMALALAFLAVALNALFLASEDLRHLGALVGVAGVVGAEEAAR